MTELEKLEAGLPFSVRDPEVDRRKLRAVKGCQKLNALDVLAAAEREAAIRELFGSAGREPVVLPVFNCDCGGNIHVGDFFLANYNVTILDIAEFRAGDHVWIGPGTLISTIGHPLSAQRLCPAPPTHSTPRAPSAAPCSRPHWRCWPERSP